MKESVIGLATSQTLDTGSWTDDGCIIASDVSTPYNAIDPCPIVDNQGDLWLCFGSFFSGIRLVRLAASTGLALADAEPKLFVVWLGVVFFLFVVVFFFFFVGFY